MAEPLRLYGLNALITHAAGGIGEASARTLVKHGATVLAVDTANSGVEQHFKSVKGIHGHSAVLNDAARMPSLVDEAIERLGSIDILINDFPPQSDVPLTDGDEKTTALIEFRSALVMSICRAALPHLKKSPAGRIVTIGFLRSVFSAEGAGSFVASEQDLAALTKALAEETGSFGITVNYVQPGAIMTPASRDVFKKDMALRDFCIASSAARRLGEPVDVAKVVLFLASADAAFVSGTGVVVDGGSASR